MDINKKVVGECHIEIFDQNGKKEWEHTNKNTLTDYGIRKMFEEQLTVDGRFDISPFNSILLANTNRKENRDMIIPEGTASGIAHFYDTKQHSHSAQGSGVKLDNTFMDGKFNLVCEWDTTKEVPEFNSVFLCSGTSEDVNRITMGGGALEDNRYSTPFWDAGDYYIGTQWVMHTKNKDTIISFNASTLEAKQFKIKPNYGSNDFSYEIVQGTEVTLPILDFVITSTTSGDPKRGVSNVLLYSPLFDRYIFVWQTRYVVEGGYTDTENIHVEFYSPYTGLLEDSFTIPKTSFDCDTLYFISRSYHANQIAVYGEHLLFSALKDNKQIFIKLNLNTREIDGIVETDIGGTKPVPIIPMMDGYFVLGTWTNYVAQIHKLVGNKMELITEIPVQRWQGDGGAEKLYYLYPIGPDAFWGMDGYGSDFHVLKLGFAPATVNILKDNAGQPISVVKPIGKSMKISYSFSFLGINNNNEAINHVTSRGLQSMLYNCLAIKDTNSEIVRPVGCARVMREDGTCIGFAETQDTATYPQYETMQGLSAPSGNGWHLDQEGNKVVDIGWSFGYGKANGKADYLLVSGRHEGGGLLNNIDGSSYGPIKANNVSFSGVDSYLIVTNWNGEFYKIKDYKVYRMRYYQSGLKIQQFALDASIDPIELSIQSANLDIPRQAFYSAHLEKWIVVSDNRWYYYDKNWNYIEYVDTKFKDNDITLETIRYVSDDKRTLYGFRKEADIISYFAYDLYEDAFVFDKRITPDMYGNGTIIGFYPGVEYFHIMVSGATVNGNSANKMVFSYKINGTEIEELGYMERTTGVDRLSRYIIPTYVTPMKYCYLVPSQNCLEHAQCYYTYKQKFTMEYNKQTEQCYTPIFRAKLK